MTKIAIWVTALSLTIVLAGQSLAMAQDPNLSQGDAPCSEFVGQEKDYCLGALDEFAAESNPTGLPASVQASASASATASASAPASQYQYNAQDQYNAGAQYDQGGGFTLPDTGGFNLPLFIGFVLLIGGLIVASKMYLSRR
jgi:hypothetical protein